MVAGFRFVLLASIGFLFPFALARQSGDNTAATRGVVHSDLARA
jgi:hypothetical protein